MNSHIDQIASAVNGTIKSNEILSDGSGVAVISIPSRPFLQRLRHKLLTAQLFGSGNGRLRVLFVSLATVAIGTVTIQTVGRELICVESAPIYIKGITGINVVRPTVQIDNAMLLEILFFVLCASALYHFVKRGILGRD